MTVASSFVQTLTPTCIEDLLHDPSRAHYYDLLGGLADNIMTIGGFAGTFLSCADCGTTFNLKAKSWACDACGRSFELKFGSRSKSNSSAYPVKVSSLDKPGAGTTHWYLSDENWSVASFMFHLLRGNAELNVSSWLADMGIGRADDGVLESVMCWPRFRFGPRTVQPDVVLAFSNRLVLFEFKRPLGGVVPALEIAGQIAFAETASTLLNRPWHLVIVPGSTMANSTTSKDFVTNAINNLDDAAAKWHLPADLVSKLVRHDFESLASRVSVAGWESVIHSALRGLGEGVQSSWSSKRSTAGLKSFWTERAKLGLLVPPPTAQPAA